MSWKKISAEKSAIFKWSINSTYIKKPPFLKKREIGKNIKNARPLLVLGDSITTDHISPAGVIKKDSTTAKYLSERQVSNDNFNSYGARRGNHEVMVRGTFANIRIKNMMVNNFSDKHLIILGTNKLDKNTGKYFNSMLVVNKHFEIIQRYDKTRLVPFGEFLPFENFLNKFGLKKITEGHGSFLKGSDNKNILVDKLNILPMICYEVIFTHLIQKSKSETNLIINISEDGWFGDTIGPDQHFAKSIFRAIENDTFLLRSTIDKSASKPSLIIPLFLILKIFITLKLVSLTR